VSQESVLRDRRDEKRASIRMRKVDQDEKVSPDARRKEGVARRKSRI
jgi:hypothetical protein